jgi:hypothetical protein
MHLLHDFLVDPILGILGRIRGRDTRLLRWLLKSLRNEKKAAVSGPCNGEFWVWQNAVGAYALTVGSLWPQNEEQDVASARDNKSKVDDPGRKGGLGEGNRMSSLAIRHEARGRPERPTSLKASGNAGVLNLRMWMDEKVCEWRQCPKMVKWDNVDAVFQKIEWLRTTEGLEVLEHMCHDTGVDD